MRPRRRARAIPPWAARPGRCAQARRTPIRRSAARCATSRRGDTVHEWYGHTTTCRLRDSPTGQQLVTAVPAHVGEAPQAPVLGAHEEHAGAPHRLGALVADPRHVLAARHAHPAAPEELTLLPVEHRLLDIGGAGQEPAVAEGSQCRRDPFGGQWSAVVSTTPRTGHAPRIGPGPRWWEGQLRCAAFGSGIGVGLRVSGVSRPERRSPRS